MRTVSRSAVPALTTEQRRAVDRAMVEDLHIELVQMMENAGRGLAELAITRFSPSSVTVLSGPGGNGGGGLVAARHLANRGCRVQVVLSEPGRLTPVPAHQADILARMDVTIASRPAAADLIIDALIGYSLRGEPTGTVAELITWATGQAAPILALDTPSGLDLTTGAPGTPAVQATATLTLALTDNSGTRLGPDPGRRTTASCPPGTLPVPGQPIRARNLLNSATICSPASSCKKCDA